MLLSMIEGVSEIESEIKGVVVFVVLIITFFLLFASLANWSHLFGKIMWRNIFIKIILESSKNEGIKNNTIACD